MVYVKLCHIEVQYINYNEEIIEKIIVVPFKKKIQGSSLLFFKSLQLFVFIEIPFRHLLSHLNKKKFKIISLIVTKKRPYNTLHETYV